MNWKEWQGLFTTFNAWLLLIYGKKKQVEGLQMFSEFAQERSPLLAYSAK